jgi:hypothetical protein
MPPVGHSSAPAFPYSRWQRLGPIVSLLLLAPVISEVLYGATRISVIFVLIPEILTWGCGALLIRECLRRWNQGWPSMLLMGLALAMAEECVIQQTSIAPLVGLAKQDYGRVWGVNWMYFLWALGYESVWVVLLPVQLTELIFPARREQMWLRTRSFVIASVVFVAGACMAWYGWTQRARVMIFHMPPYTPPVLYIVTALGVIALLILAAYALPSFRPRPGQTVSHAPSPWLVGSIVTALGTPWGAFVLLGFGSLPALPFRLGLAVGTGWCALTLFLVWRWTSSTDWGDAHRFALTFGGVLACMLGGFVVFKVGGALRIDWIGKTILNLIAIVWLVSLGRNVVMRGPRPSINADHPGTGGGR